MAARKWENSNVEKTNLLFWVKSAKVLKCCCLIKASYTEASALLAFVLASDGLVFTLHETISPNYDENPTKTRFGVIS